MIEDGDVRSEGGIYEPCSDIIPNQKDIRSKYGYTTLCLIPPPRRFENIYKYVQIFLYGGGE